MDKSIWQYQLAIVALGLVLFVPFLGAVHLFDWDEINFAECAREMVQTGDYFSVSINYQPFWEKPPVFIWMQALSMNIFGINEFAARLPNAICGIITLLVLFNIGQKLYDEKFGLIWALAYAGSFLPHFYFKSGIIDPWFNLFIFSGCWAFISFKNTQKLKLLLLSAVLIGLAMLTKGPVALLIFGLCIGIYWVINGFKFPLTIQQTFIYGLAVVFVGSFWFLMLYLSGNGEIIEEFFVYQVRLFNTRDAGHGGPFFYHWIVLLIGCFPVSVFALQGFKTSNLDTLTQKQFKLWMEILFWVVLILFSIVKTKIVHYSSLCYFPLSFLGSYTIYKLIMGEWKWKKSSGIILVCIAGIIGAVIFLLPIIDRVKQDIIDANIIKDKFAEENLKAIVHWSGFEGLIGLGLIVGLAIMLRLIKKNKLQQGILGIFMISLLVINAASIVIVPRVEKYSQAAAVEFYEYLADKDCYIETLGFKSYAHLFYSNKQEQKNNKAYNKEWLLRGKIDKPAYFVSKITSLEEIKRDYPELKTIYRKNGFVFFLRNTKNKTN